MIAPSYGSETVTVGCEVTRLRLDASIRQTNTETAR
jgi:hypothetical protein